MLGPRSITRRDFLRLSALATSGLAIGSLPAIVEAAPSHPLITWPWSVSLSIETLSRSPWGIGPYLDLAHRLGAAMIRVDLPWNLVQPERDAWLQEQVTWLRRLVEGAHRRGLEVIGNLDGYPKWALADLSHAPDRFYGAWYEYVIRMVEGLNSPLCYYQLGNEFNSILDPIPAALDAQVFNVARDALDAVESSRPAWKRLRTVINPFFGFFNIASEWDPALRRVLHSAAHAIDVIALDYYPGSYNPFGNPANWRPLESVAQYAREYGKMVAIGETGCPTFMWGQAHQVKWLHETARALVQKVEDLDLGDRMAFVNIFELVDRAHLATWEFWRPTEVTLGLVDQNLKPKLGFYALQQLISGSPGSAIAGPR